MNWPEGRSERKTLAKKSRSPESVPLAWIHLMTENLLYAYGIRRWMT